MTTLATRMAFGKELLELAKTNTDFVVCSADTKTCGIEHFGQLFPGREFSFGIAEQDLMASAAGLASCGNKVFVATFAVFATMRACEQVRTFICHPNLNVTIIGTHTGLQVGGDGATHAAVEDVSIMRAFPNMTIVQPSDAVEAKAMVQSVIDFRGPLYVRLHRNPVPDIRQEGTFNFEMYKSYTLAEYGHDVALLASGILTKKALDAALKLKDKGIGATVVEFPTIKPLNKEDVIEAAKKCGAVMTIEDHTVFGGFGSAVAEVLGENYPVPLKLIGIQDRFGESGDPELLYKDNHMDVDSIVVEAERLIHRK